MSYCRWNNTVLDMRDCLNTMNGWMKDNECFSRKSYYETLSLEEKVAFDCFWNLLIDFEKVIEHSIRYEYYKENAK